MGLTYTHLGLSNFFTGKRVEIRALVDTGALHMCVTAAIAESLGFDISEVETVPVTVADGRRLHVPRIAPIKIEFANRTYVTEAFVIGDEPLLGAVPIEAMDLIVHPATQELRVNPAHPDCAVFPVKVARHHASRIPERSTQR